MDRIASMIIRSAVRQLTNRGISGGINYISSRVSKKRNLEFDQVEKTEVEVDQVRFDKNSVSKKIRVNRMRF